MAEGGFGLSEYMVPKFGLKERVPGGGLPKDPGTFSSRLAQVVRAATKVPGPGKYEFKDTLGSATKFSVPKAPRDKYNVPDGSKGPAPGKYEAIPLDRTKARVIGGLCSKGKGHRPIFNVSEGPAPGKYDVKMQPRHVMAPSMTIRKTESRKDPALSKSASAPGPGKYNPNFSSQETQEAIFSVPKAPHDKTRYVDSVVISKKFVPAPGKYDLPKLDKVSRGTKWCQLNGLGRSPLNGAF